MSEWTPELETELQMLYQGADGNEGFSRAAAFEALKEYFTREAERLTVKLNAGTESLDAFLERPAARARTNRGIRWARIRGDTRSATDRRVQVRSPTHSAALPENPTSQSASCPSCHAEAR